MLKEFAAGAVIVRRERGQLLYLLIYSRRNSIWGFPKGHLEPGETEKEAALREIQEETGLDAARLAFLDGFRHEDIYPAASTREATSGLPIEKHSVYYLASTREEHIITDNDEISDFRWVEFDAALSLIAFESMREVLRAAHTFLRHRFIDKEQ